MAMVRYPLPITQAMLTLANPYFDRPRYTSGTDWNGGSPGNEEDVAATIVSIKSAAANTAADAAIYAPRTQAAKATATTSRWCRRAAHILDDLSIDYGTYAGQAGRTGPVTPLAPIPMPRRRPSSSVSAPPPASPPGAPPSRSPARASRGPRA